MNYIVTLFVVGCVVIAWHRSAPRAGKSASAWRRVQAMGWVFLLLPLAIAAIGLFGTNSWTIAALVLAGTAVVLAPALAAHRVPLALVLLGLCGMAIATAAFRYQPQHGFQFTVSRTSFVRIAPLPRAPRVAAPRQITAARPASAGFATLPRQVAVSSIVLPAGAGRAGSWWNMLIVPEACLFLAFGLWLIPRRLGTDSWTVKGLARRVQRLAETRTDAVDSAAAELRRVERDLHDGAQARLVAVGMSLRAAERLMGSSPHAALALVAEARETSSRALADLRNLVRGIHPPVLADRGLADAVRALALDTPVRTDLDIDLPGRPEAPVESAAYFAVAEVLANAVKHAGAHAVEIQMQHCGGVLRIAVTDDGVGGADPAKGSGLRGVERRLGAFDGILAVNSPPGGPTIVIIEVPCGLS
jgi:signal transduction histidine kinase